MNFKIKILTPTFILDGTKINKEMTEVTGDKIKIYNIDDTLFDELTNDQLKNLINNDISFNELRNLAKEKKKLNVKTFTVNSYGGDSRDMFQTITEYVNGKMYPIIPGSTLKSVFLTDIKNKIYNIISKKQNWKEIINYKKLADNLLFRDAFTDKESNESLAYYLIKNKKLSYRKSNLSNGAIGIVPGTEFAGEFKLIKSRDEEDIEKLKVMYGENESEILKSLIQETHKFQKEMIDFYKSKLRDSSFFEKFYENENTIIIGRWTTECDKFYSYYSKKIKKGAVLFSKIEKCKDIKKSFNVVLKGYQEEIPGIVEVKI